MFYLILFRLFYCSYSYSFSNNNHCILSVVYILINSTYFNIILACFFNTWRFHNHRYFYNFWIHYLQFRFMTFLGRIIHYSLVVIKV